MEKQYMIKSFEVIRPVDFPYRLMSFRFFFNNVNTHIMNMHHAAGMDFIYTITKTCYLFPQNEFYELLKLQNIQEPHEAKYNWLLMKGIFGGEPAFETDLKIENVEILELLQPENSIDKKHLHLYRLPEAENDIVISEEIRSPIFHHFLCNEVLIQPGSSPLINMIYLNSYNKLYQILSLWFDEENKQMMLS